MTLELTLTIIFTILLIAVLRFVISKGWRYYLLIFMIAWGLRGLADGCSVFYFSGGCG